MLGLTDKGIKAAIINIFKEQGNYALKSKKSSGDSVSSKVKDGPEEEQFCMLMKLSWYQLKLGC